MEGNELTLAQIIQVKTINKVYIPLCQDEADQKECNDPSHRQRHDPTQDLLSSSDLCHYPTTQLREC